MKAFFLVGLSNIICVKILFCIWYLVGFRVMGFFFFLGFWAGEVELIFIMFFRIFSFGGCGFFVWLWLMVFRRWIIVSELSCRGRRVF